MAVIHAEGEDGQGVSGDKPIKQVVLGVEQALDVERKG
jgi:hypothetical protein